MAGQVNRDEPYRYSGLWEMLDRWTQRAPRRPAFTFVANGECASDSLTFAELATAAQRFSAALPAVPGERALLIFPPGLDYVVAFWACIYSGAVAVPLPFPVSDRDVAQLNAVVKDCNAPYIVGPKSVLARARPMLQSADGRKVRWIVAEGLAKAKLSTLDSSVGNSVVIPPDDVCYLQYTSGSTREPRGVKISSRNVLSNLDSIDLDFKHTSASVIVSWLPHFHDMGLVYGILAPVFAGCHCYLMSPASFVQRPRRWLETISKYRATHSGAPNFAYNLCIRRIGPDSLENLDLSSWRVAFSGAEPVRRETLDRFAQVFSKAGFAAASFFPAYGLAEATLKVTSRDRGGFVHTDETNGGPGGSNNIIVGCGRPTPGTAVRIIDTRTFLPCEDKKIGEIWVAGPGVAAGYWNRAAETKETFEAFTAEQAGPFLRTGDLGFIENDELYVCGRIKDVIIIRGRNYYPQDIEFHAQAAHSSLAGRPGAAFAIDADGEVRLIMVQEIHRRWEREAAAACWAVYQALSGTLALQLHEVVITGMGTLPVTSSGKIMRSACRDLFRNGTIQRLASSSGPTAPRLSCSSGATDSSTPSRAGDVRAYLVEQVASVLRRDRTYIEPDIALVAQGLDSLAAAELAENIERELGLNIPVGSLLGQETIRSLAARLIESGTRATPQPDIQSFRISGIVRPATLPLSIDQERLWALSRHSKSTPSNCIVTAFTLPICLDISLLRKALAYLTHRHEALRTCFPLNDGVPIQSIQERVEPELLVKNTDCVSACISDEKIREWVRESLAHVGFELQAGPLWRVGVYRTSHTQSVMALVCHHLIADARSIRIWFSELGTIYGDLAEGKLPELPQLPAQYVDFAIWQRDQLRRGVWDDQIRYWRSMYEGGIPSTPATARIVTGILSPTIDAFDFPSLILNELRDVCRRELATEFIGAMAACGVAVHLITRSPAITLFVAVAGRTNRDTNAVIGPFAFPLPLSMEVTSQLTLRMVLSNVRDAALGLYSNQDVPFTRLIQEVGFRDVNGDSSLPVLFSVVNDSVEDFIFGKTPAAVQEYSVDDAGFAIKFLLSRNSRGLHVQIECGAGPCASSAHEVTQLYQHVLTNLAEAPDIRLAHLALTELPKSFVERTSQPSVARWQSIVIGATFTCDPIVETLQFWESQIGETFKIQLLPYGQLLQDLHSPTGAFRGAKNGLNVVLLRWRDFLRHAQSSADVLVQVADELSRGFAQASADGAAHYLVMFCSEAVEAGEYPAVRQMEVELTSRLTSVCRNLGFSVIHAAEILETYPLTEVFDRHAEQLGHIPFTPEYFGALGTLIVRKAVALSSAPCKAIILDCDDTLWTGACGDDGPSGVRIDESRRAIQEFMLLQKVQGRLLCLCSRNDDVDVVAVFDSRSDMVISLEDCAARRVNWKAKSENVRDLAAELGIGLENVLFIDDDPLHCWEVQTNCPQVAVFQVPRNLDDFLPSLKHLWLLDTASVTEEDRRRTELYRSRAIREQVRSQSDGLEDFIARLEIRINASALDADNINRVSQLTYRTNQFNSTGRRWSEGELRQFIRSGTGEAILVACADRFGDYGNVGLILFIPARDSVIVESFLLSCRALGRGVEHQMMQYLGAVAAERGKTAVEMRYVATGRNGFVYDFFRSVAGEPGQGTESSLVFRCSAVQASQAQYKEYAGAKSNRVLTDANERDNALPVIGANATRVLAAGTAWRDMHRLVTAQRRLSSPVRRSTAAGVAPRTATEREVARVFEEALKVSPVCVDEDFLELGGSSLVAVQVVARLRRQYDVEISLTRMLSGKATVEGIAAMIHEQIVLQSEDKVLAESLAEINRLSDDEVRLMLGGNTSGKAYTATGE